MLDRAASRGASSNIVYLCFHFLPPAHEKERPKFTLGWIFHLHWERLPGNHPIHHSSLFSLAFDSLRSEKDALLRILSITHPHPAHFRATSCNSIHRFAIFHQLSYRNLFRETGGVVSEYRRSTVSLSIPPSLLRVFLVFLVLNQVWHNPVRILLLPYPSSRLPRSLRNSSPSLHHSPFPSSFAHCY